MTQEDSQTTGVEIRGQGEVVAGSKVRLLKTIALMRSENSSEADESTLARKAAKYDIRCPYRKPTQVDGKKIPRRTGEPLLRNSAKRPRNFGRRGATDEVAAVKRPKRLFTKNTGLCESAS